MVVTRLTRQFLLLFLTPLLFFALGCATTTTTISTGPRPEPFPKRTTPGTTAGAPPITAPSEIIPSGTFGQSLVETALGFRGVPYRNGGDGPAGFDCSGLVQYVLLQHGIAMPRDTEEQYRYGEKIDLDDIQPGDLLFFRTVSRGASHVGIAVDQTSFVHAPTSRGFVRIDSVTEEYWHRRYLGARRILEPRVE